MRFPHKHSSRSPRVRDPVTGEPLSTLEEIVTHYIKHERKRAEENLDFFRKCASLSEAIKRATLARTSKGTKHPHQQRITQDVLQESCVCLMAHEEALQGCASFAELHDLINNLLLPIQGIGILTIYDTALHIGAYLELLPTQVYIHRGVRNGLRALGYNVKQRPTITLAELPTAFRLLQPYEIEDCLCIYKDSFTPAM